MKIIFKKVDQPKQVLLITLRLHWEQKNKEWVCRSGNNRSFKGESILEAYQALQTSTRHDLIDLMLSDAREDVLKNPQKHGYDRVEKATIESLSEQELTVPMLLPPHGNALTIVRSKYSIKENVDSSFACALEDLPVIGLGNGLLESLQTCMTALQCYAERYTAEANPENPPTGLAITPVTMEELSQLTYAFPCVVDVTELRTGAN